METSSDGRTLSAGEYGYYALEVGDHYLTAGVTVTDAHIVGFAGLSGDLFELHMDDEFARALGFPRRIAHGLLGLALIDGLKTRSPVRLAGIATLGWDWSFCAPLQPGDRIHASIVVAAKRLTSKGDRGIVTFALQVFNQYQQVIQQGETRLLMQL